jgi:hypothetical protein
LLNLFLDKLFVELQAAPMRFSATSTIQPGVVTRALLPSLLVLAVLILLVNGTGQLGA